MALIETYVPAIILQFGPDRIIPQPSLNYYAAPEKVNSPMHRPLSPDEQWPEILQCACNQELQIIFFNGPEIRNDFVLDNINASPPFSSPGKLLAFLFQRFKHFGGLPERGLVIISSEQAASAGTLEAIALELAHLNNLEVEFLDWIENSIYFCNKSRN